MLCSFPIFQRVFCNIDTENGKIKKKPGYSCYMSLCQTCLCSCNLTIKGRKSEFNNNEVKVKINCFIPTDAH